ncbi:hypothetical protein Tco_0085096 [Tanacetum coccineum]
MEDIFPMACNFDMESCSNFTGVADKAVYKELDDSLETPNEAGSQGTTLGGGPRHQETMEDTIAQTRSENVSKHSNDSLLTRGNTLRSGEDSLKLQELMALCTNLQQRVLDLEQTKTIQAKEIVSLKRRVKKLEQKKRSRTHGLKILYKVGSSRRVESSDEEGLGKKDASKQGRIGDIYADAGITLVSTHFDANTDIFGVHDLVGDEVVVESEVAVKASEKRNVVAEIDAASTILVSAATITNVEITLAQALAELKSTKPKAKGTDKSKAKMIEPEPVKKLLKKDQLMLDEELAFKLQAEEEEEEERLTREKDQQIEEVNIAWDDVKAKVKADYQLAQRLQAQEQEEMTDEVTLKNYTYI